MQELMARLDEESRHRARLEAEHADLRAKSEFPVRLVHIGTPPGLPDTNRESTGGDRPFMPPLPPGREGVVSLASSHIDPRKDGGPPGGEPPKGPGDDDDGDDDDSDDDRRRRKDDKKKKKDKGRKKSRGRRRRRSPYPLLHPHVAVQDHLHHHQEVSLIRRQSRS